MSFSLPLRVSSSRANREPVLAALKRSPRITAHRSSSLLVFKHGLMAFVVLKSRTRFRYCFSVLPELLLLLGEGGSFNYLGDLPERLFSM